MGVGLSIIIKSKGLETIVANTAINYFESRITEQKDTFNRTIMELKSL